MLRSTGKFPGYERRQRTHPTQRGRRSRWDIDASEAFKGENITDKKITERVEQVANELVRFTEALLS